MTDITPLAAALTPERWARVNRELAAKLLTELTYEELLAPVSQDRESGAVLPAVGTRESFVQPLGERLSVAFAATLRSLDVWRVDPASLRWTLDGQPQDELDVVDLVAIGAPAIGASTDTTVGLVRELANTVLADAWGDAVARTVDELIDLPADELEGEMRGHPWIVANKGRLGFDARDIVDFAPESQPRLELPWMAVRRDRAESAALDGLDHATVIAEQVGQAGLDELRERATAAGMDADDVLFVPVHPWQMAQRIVPLHAGDLARREIVPLGTLDRLYRPQISIRTLTDAEDPTRRAIKLPLSILNTSVYRGLPREATLAAPALSAWFGGLIGADPFLQERGLVVLAEQASISVAHRTFGLIPDAPYQHTEMLGALWREPLAPRLREGERGLTMTALLHRDPSGRAFVEPLIARSGLSVGEWVDRLHDVVLPPLMHVLYRFGATFSPHAQNCLLLLKDDVPVRLAVKDVVDDATITSDPLPELASMPDAVRRALGHGVESTIATQWIQSGLLICVYRYVAEILADRMGYDEAAFWASAERAVAGYQERFADELEPRFELFDFEAPSFVKLCLNRVRILGRGYADAPDRPIAAATGFVTNPLAPNENPSR